MSEKNNKTVRLQIALGNSTIIYLWNEELQKFIMLEETNSEGKHLREVKSPRKLLKKESRCGSDLLYDIDKWDAQLENLKSQHFDQVSILKRENDALQSQKEYWRLQSTHFMEKSERLMLEINEIREIRERELKHLRAECEKK